MRRRNSSLLVAHTRTGLGRRHHVAPACLSQKISVAAAQSADAATRFWSVDDARRFLESARQATEALYAAFVLILVLGLRKGEVLGLTWELVNLDTGELYIGEQVQRVGHRLIRRQVKTEPSEAPLPLPDLCVAALKLRRQQQDADRARAGEAWRDTGLVFTTRYGTPIEPRNFSRSFDRCIASAGVPRITVHGTRKTCGSLLAALEVHPRVAMQILRHSKIAVTMEIYTRGALGRHSGRAPEAGAVARLGFPGVTAALCCCTRQRNGQLQDRNWPLSWVGDTGIEPVTSSV